MSDNDFKHLAVEFYTKAQENKRKSAEEGRPIYDEIEMIKIRIAGDPKTVHCAPAHDQSSARDPHTNERLTYAQLHHGPYEAFKRGKEYVGSGTPLKELSFLSESKRKELEALHIHTAEALSQLDGTNLQRLGMGGRELKNQAQAWLDKASGSADVTRLAAENAAMAERLAQLEAMMIEQAKVAPPIVEEVPAIPTAASPFQDWDADTIRLWIEEQGGDKPHHKTGHAKLVEIADELNEKLAKQNEAA